MAICDKCLHYEVCKYGERRSNGIYCSGEDCLQFKDRTKWVTRTESRWIDHGYYVECPVCNHEVSDESYLGDAVACPNCGALLQPAE